MGGWPNLAEAMTDYVHRLPEALLLTLIITAGAGVIGLSLGLLLAFGQSAGGKVARVSQTTVAVLRSVPVPPLMYLIYFAVLSTIYPIDPAHAGMIALGILLAPYMAEVFRSGIQSVQKGYIEAGMALGMSGNLVRRRIILPISTRIMLPLIGQLLVGTLLNSAFVAILGGIEITGMSRKIIYQLFTTEMWIVVAATYFVIAFPMSRAFSYLERRWKVGM
jgi:polar amino acid transport system permease protein